MGSFFYHIFLLSYSIGAKIASFFNAKAKLWVAGRKNWHNKLGEWVKGLPADKKIVWIHCPSLGEFEQGRPVLEAIREKFPEYQILLSFFSPSGYEVRKNYAKADYITYLPLDNYFTAKKFIETVSPSLVIWVKYDYWYYFLTGLADKNIPVVLISAIFRKNQPFFKWYGEFWKKMLKAFDKIFVQNEESISLLKQIGIVESVSLAGDTRYDRVVDIANNFEPLPQLVTDFCCSNKVIVAGSTWEEDEEILTHFTEINKDIKFIIAPHEVDADSIGEVKRRFKGAILFSELEKYRGADVNVMIIDNIGMLSRLYKLATITYIGGGFNDSGIHNTLEAAVHGKPVVFGPVYEKFAEAIGLIDAKAAFSVQTALQLEEIFGKLLENKAILIDAGNTAREFVYANCGATKKIMDYLCEKRLLIK